MRAPSRAANWWVAFGLVVLLMSMGSPASAKPTPIRTSVVAHVTPATAYVHSVVVVSGTVKPHSASPMEVQRLVAKKWVNLASGKVSPAGAYAVSLRAPGKPAGWSLRVIRAANGSVRAGVSAVLHVRIVKTRFAVSASSTAGVNVGNPVVVSGAVSPKALGSVALQSFSTGVWRAVASAKLTAASTYSASLSWPVGSYRLRVVKAFSTKVAAGTSAAFTVTVTSAPVVPPPPPPPPRGSANTEVAWGFDKFGQLGGTTPGSRPEPAPVAGLTGVVAVAGGGSDGYALRYDGTVWAWGRNDVGELGNGGTADSRVPVPVSGITDATAIAASGSTAFALRSDGTVWSWGSNLYGQLGNGSTVDSPVPVRVSGLTGVRAIATGGLFALALGSDGTVYSWGFGMDGELGNNGVISSATPVQVTGLIGVTAIGAGANDGYAVAADGTVRAWGASGALGNGGSVGSTVPVQVSGLTGAVAVSGGVLDGYAVGADGRVWAWGNGANGELGNGSLANASAPVLVTGLAGVSAVSGSGSWAMALLVTGGVVGWGYDGAFQLGTGTTVAKNPSPVPVTGLSGVVGIAAGGAAAYAIRSG
jgi:alpha-tubulin suppressor-like RCC1 family protein